jgi:nucleoside-diphosphate-sugar epimerase
MRILITGAQGFLGKNIVRKFESLNHAILKLSYRDEFPDIEYSILKFNPHVTIHCGWFGVIVLLKQIVLNNIAKMYQIALNYLKH